jgi:hypothetical protein
VPAVRSLPQVLLLALLLVVVDAFLMNQGVISLLVAATLLLVSVPRTLLRRFAAVRSRRLANVAVYLGAVVLVFVLNGINNSIAAGRGEGLVSAVNAFHAKYQQYPESLDALVPEFIAAVPRAKYTLQFSEFMYFRTEQGASLSYVRLPPFGRPTYDFNSRRWGYLD